jgi:hypothetical protein
VHHASLIRATCSSLPTLAVASTRVNGSLQRCAGPLLARQILRDSPRRHHPPSAWFLCQGRPRQTCSRDKVYSQRWGNDSHEPHPRKKSKAKVPAIRVLEEAGPTSRARRKPTTRTPKETNRVPKTTGRRAGRPATTNMQGVGTKCPAGIEPQQQHSAATAGDTQC